jgi:hypothetical protein
LIANSCSKNPLIVICCYHSNLIFYIFFIGLTKKLFNLKRFLIRLTYSFALLIPTFFYKLAFQSNCAHLCTNQLNLFSYFILLFDYFGNRFSVTCILLLQNAAHFRWCGNCDAFFAVPIWRRKKGLASESSHFIIESESYLSSFAVKGMEAS